MILVFEMHLLRLQRMASNLHPKLQSKAIRIPVFGLIVCQYIPHRKSVINMEFNLIHVKYRALKISVLNFRICSS